MFALSALLMGLAGVAHAADGVHWTILGPHAVAFEWQGAESTIVFRSNAPYWRSVTAHTPLPAPDPPGSQHHEAVLSLLLPDALYHYRIGDGPESTFRTPPPAGTADFWFAAEADIGSSLTYAGVAPTQAQIAADEPHVPGDDRPRFVLGSGDLTYGDQNDLADVDAHFDDVQVWSREAAYMPAWGNHEWECLPPGCSAKPDNLNDYEGRFVLPNSQEIPGAAHAVGNGPADDWDWFDYGNTRFISMPSLDLSGARVAWESAVVPVMAAAQADPAIAFIVVHGHFPAWSSGSDHGGDTSLQALLVSLRASYPKFVLVLQGHSHHYERWSTEQTGGLVSVVSGGGGSDCGGLATTRPAGSVVRWNELNHLKVHVLPDRIEGWAVCGPAGASGCSGQCGPGGVIDRWTIATGTELSVGGPPPAPPAVHEGVYYDVAGRQVREPLRSGVYFRVRGQVRQVVVIR